MPLPESEVQALISLARRYLTQEDVERVLVVLRDTERYRTHDSYRATIDRLAELNELRWLPVAY